MIDLHTHTRYSDGTDSVAELLSNAESKKLNIISITDHNTALAYNELKKMNYKQYYTGEIAEKDFINGTIDSGALSVEKQRQSVALEAYEKSKFEVTKSLLILEVITRTPILRK